LKTTPAILLTGATERHVRKTGSGREPEKRGDNGKCGSIGEGSCPGLKRPSPSRPMARDGGRKPARKDYSRGRKAAKDKQWVGRQVYCCPVLAKNTVKVGKCPHEEGRVVCRKSRTTLRATLGRQVKERLEEETSPEGHTGEQCRERPKSELEV